MAETGNNGGNWDQEQESSLQLIDIWHLIWDHKWWYVLSVLIVGIAAAFYIYRSPVYYSRTAKVIIDEGAQEAAMRDLSSFAGGMSRYRYSTNVDNEVEAIASPDLMETVVARLGLETSYYEHQILRTVELGDGSPIAVSLAGDNPLSSFSFDIFKASGDSYELSNFKVGPDEVESEPVRGNLRDTVSTPMGRLVITPVLSNNEWEKPITVVWRNTKMMAKAYSAATSVEISGKQTSVVVLQIRDKFPSRAENILNTLIDVYNESWIHNKNRSARSTTAFINDRLVIIEQELSLLENQLKDFKEDNKITDMKSLGAMYLEESSEYEARSFEVMNQLAIAKYIRDYLNDPANSLALIPANSGISSTSVEAQIKQYNEILLERDRLLSTSTESNPLIVDANNSISSMRGAILRSVDNLVSTLELQKAQIQAKEDMILRKIASNTGQEFELLSIERQRKVKESLYVYLLQKREENELTSLINVGNTRLIMAPNGSPAPVAPRRMVILFMAVVFGCAIPFAVFYLAKTLDTGVHYKDDVTSILKIPFLAEIPEVGRKKKLRRRRKISRDDSNRRIVVKAGKRNSVNEAFRVLRTNVDMMLSANGGSRVIMLTSSYPGSGKTFISLNLSSSMALKGMKVVVVDLDLRKASLSEAVGAGSVGAASYLNGSTDNISDCISNFADNLDIMGVGSIPPNPTELLLSDRFREMMVRLKESYDYVFLDCPPAEIVADAAIISALADLTIYVVRAGLMDKKVLPQVQELSDSGRFNRMTAVLNGVKSEGGKYGYGKYGYGKGGYTYGNVYGEGSKEDED